MEELPFAGGHRSGAQRGDEIAERRFQSLPFWIGLLVSGYAVAVGICGPTRKNG
jgi:hypothetical protein